MDELINELKELSMNNFPNEKVYNLLENSHLDHKDIEDYIQFSEEKYIHEIIDMLLFIFISSNNHKNMKYIFEKSIVFFTPT